MNIKKITVFFRFTLIEKYLEKLDEIKLKSFYIKKCINPFKIRFPNLCYLEYFDYSEVHYKILEDLEDLVYLEGLKDPGRMKILGDDVLAYLIILIIFYYLIILSYLI